MQKAINLTGTSSMKDNSFIDTNILIYSHSDIDQKKRDDARTIYKQR